MITGNGYNDFAYMFKQNETKCGIEGKYFEQEKNVEFKIFMHEVIYLIFWYYLRWYFNSLYY